MFRRKSTNTKNSDQTEAKAPKTSTTPDTVNVSSTVKSVQDIAATVTPNSMDIFLSVHVATMGQAAKQLKTALEAQGRSVFLCTDLDGGVNFRDEIISGVKACKVFVPLMSAEWASSGECESEFLLAKRLNLTSHERKLTKPPQARKPIFLPVAFPNLNPWNRFPHVELLAASTNFVLAPTDNQLDERMITMISTMASKLCTENTDVSSLIVTQGDAALMNFGSLRAALDALDVYLGQATSILAGANALSAKGSAKRNEAERLFPIPRKLYIGFTYGRINEFVETVFSLEIRLETSQINKNGSSNDKNIPVSGHVVYKICSVNVKPEFDKSSNIYAFINTLSEKAGGDAYAELSIKGRYVLENGLLMLDDDEVVHDGTGFTTLEGWQKDSYRLLVSHDATELTGTLRGWHGAWDIAFRATAF